MKRNLLLKIILWSAGVTALLLTAAQILLSSSLLPRIINKVAVSYVDGDISFGKAEVSVFRRFPKITMTLEDFSVTYPADRYDSLERAGVQGHMLYHGCGEEADTLASFKEFSASLRLLPLLSGKIHIPHIELVNPRIFAHSYDEANANWNMFGTGSGPEQAVDSTTSEKQEKAGAQGLPSINLGHVRMSGHPHIVYTDSKDTLFAMVDLKQLAIDGKLKSRKMSGTRIGMRMDSLFVAGRFGRDTIAVGLDMLAIHEHRGHMDFKAEAKAFAATSAFGRLRVPLKLKGALSFPKDEVPHVKLSAVDALVAGIPLSGEADIRLAGGRTGIKSHVEVNGSSIQDIISNYLVNFIPEVEGIATDGLLNISADIDGYYDKASGALPAFTASVSIPEADFSYSGIPCPLRAGAVLGAYTGDDGRINVTVNEVTARSSGFSFGLKGTVADVLGDDPSLEIDTKLYASLDSLQKFLPDTSDIHATGILDAEITGSARMSQLNVYNFGEARLRGKADLKGIDIDSAEDSLCIEVDSLGITIGPEIRTSRRDPSRSFELLAVNGAVNRADINYKGSLRLRGRNIKVSAKNSLPEEGDTSTVSHFGGNVSADMLSIRDSHGSSVMLRNSSNSFQMIPKRGQPTLPMLTFSSKNRRISLTAAGSRVVLTDAGIRAKAAMNTIDRRLRRQAFTDSLARMYPEIPRDSLFRHYMSRRRPHDVPEWMQEEDFKSSDIDIRLDNTIAKYFREWDLNGTIDVRSGTAITPLFPLRNTLEEFKCSFDNDRIAIDRTRLMAGKSEITAKGELTGLRMALLRKGLLKLDIDITSEGMDANELLKAYNAGSSFKPESTLISEDISDEEFMEMVMRDTVSHEKKSNLIVIPANLNADISIDAEHIRYSDLDIRHATAQLIVKERCVQITNTNARTNMGNISFDGFYSTRSKKDLKTGFSLNLVDITAEKVIDLMPSVDTLMPLLKSFKGLLNCEIAGTARLDTDMNLVMPSINAIMRISGEDLSISDNELFRTLARKLLFKNKNEGTIKKMTVEGIIKDNVFEIFPFVLKMDRYTMAMSGRQNLDMSFKYHVSVLKSPFLIRLGIDLSGKDFDHLKFRIGKAKYKTAKVPVFSTVIDQTKINLLSSIKGIFEKGVEAAVMENEAQEAINRHRKETEYVNAADISLEELSAQEQEELERTEASESTIDDISAKAAEELKKIGIL